MPRESGSRGRSEPDVASNPIDRARAGTAGALELTRDLRQQLLPWIDLDEVGEVGLRAWILSVLPLLPRPTRGGNPLDRDVSRAAPPERIRVLAEALAECASDRARAHFQASEYFRENRVLARRLKALEAMVRTKVATGQMEAVDLTDREAEAAVHRYLPSDRR